MDTRENFTRTSLRIPQDLYDQLVDATAGKRSLNAEIIARLEESFKHPNEDAVNVRIDTNGSPISWGEIHRCISAINDSLRSHVVTLNVQVVTSKLVSSGDVREEAPIHPPIEAPIPQPVPLPTAASEPVPFTDAMQKHVESIEARAMAKMQRMMEEEASTQPTSHPSDIAAFEAEMKQALDRCNTAEDFEALMNSGIRSRLRAVAAVDLAVNIRIIAMLSRKGVEIYKRQEKAASKKLGGSAA